MTKEFDWNTVKPGMAFCHVETDHLSYNSLSGKLMRWCAPSLRGNADIFEIDHNCNGSHVTLNWLPLRENLIRKPEYDTICRSALTARLDVHLVLDALALAAKGQPIDPELCETIENIARLYAHKDFDEDDIQALYDSGSVHLEASDQEKLKRLRELGVPDSALKLVQNDHDKWLAFAELLQSSDFRQNLSKGEV